MSAPQTRLGQLIEGDAGRDAVHIAVAPVTAAEKLSPSEDVGLLADGLRAGRTPLKNGIVDPFLRSDVQPGQRFWLFLYPNTITGLRHEWTHPAFGDREITAADRTIAQQVVAHLNGDEIWLREYADEYGLSLRALIASAGAWVADGEYHRLSFDLPDRGYTDNDEFWRRYERYTGRAVEPDKRENFFSCSC